MAAESSTALALTSRHRCRRLGLSLGEVHVAQPQALQAQTRIVVTGGTGFLGRHLMAALGARGYGRVTAVGAAEYDLTHEDQVMRMLADLNPEAVIHLAAVVGGIGANRRHPGSFFYKNLMMGS